MDADLTDQALRVLAEFHAAQLMETLNRLGNQKTELEEGLAQALDTYLLTLEDERRKL